MARTGPVRAVVAVDFGTSRSGYAFAYAGDKREIRWPSSWPEQRGAYIKAPTQLLYAPKGHLLAWGWPAVTQHAEACNKVRTSEFILGASPEDLLRQARQIARKLPSLIGGFKMLIPEGRKGAAGLVLTDEAGRDFSLIWLVADYLAELRKFILHHLRGDNPSLDEAEILWCLTVPAIWTDAEKQFMREAARRAELIPQADDERLLLVLEPEAAALACLDEAAGGPLAPGSTFLLVDAGGGTVDLTVHEVDARGLKEVVPGSGAACGSTYLDRQFKEFLREMLGQRAYQRLTRDEPVVFQEMMASWEVGKCAFEGPSGRTLQIPIHRALERILRQTSPKFFERLAQRQRGNEDSIEVPAAEIDRIFRPVLDEMVAAIRAQLDAVSRAGRRCEAMFLVGGFAESKALQERLRREFVGASVKTLLVPGHPGRAVLQGAVLFGLDQTRITSRRARLTYGCDTCLPFVEGVDPPENKVWNADLERYECPTRFSPFVAAGQLVGFDECIRKRFTVTRRQQTGMTFTFFATPQPQARFITEAGMTKIGKLTVSLPAPSDDLGRAVEVRFFFGRTEVQVEAQDVQSGRVAQCSLKFD